MIVMVMVVRVMGVFDYLFVDDGVICICAGSVVDVIAVMMMMAMMIICCAACCCLARMLYCNNRVMRRWVMMERMPR